MNFRIGTIATLSLALIGAAAAFGQSPQLQLGALASQGKPRAFSPLPDRVLFSGQSGCHDHRPRDESGSMCYGACANPELICDTIGNRCACR